MAKNRARGLRRQPTDVAISLQLKKGTQLFFYQARISFFLVVFFALSSGKGVRPLFIVFLLCAEGEIEGEVE